MKNYHHYVGIDPSSETFAAAIYQGPEKARSMGIEFVNKLEGYDKFQTWLSDQEIDKKHCLICLENTGVYNEALAYFLSAQGYFLSLESPQKVKRAFKIKGHKTDPVDAAQIAEYAYRYEDRLKKWQPKSDVIQQLGTLLSTREQLVKQKRSTDNALKSLQRKVVTTVLATNIYEQNSKQLETQIGEIQTEMQKLISQDAHLQNTMTLLQSVPGVGPVTALNLLVITDDFQQINLYPKLAAFIGICPYQHTSGTSIKKRDTSSKQGPPRLRKCLHMGARSLMKCNPKFVNYYQHKVAQGKHPNLVLNNIANKVIRIACSVIQHQKPYDKKYVSLKPISLKTA